MIRCPGYSPTGCDPVLDETGHIPAYSPTHPDQTATVFRCIRGKLKDGFVGYRASEDASLSASA
jgi:hypothetical protein